MQGEKFLPLVAALAGRRIDAPDADARRFPLEQASAVRSALSYALLKRQVCKLICSAACGADLLALEAARALGIHRRIILPFAADAFRLTSVVDRPGDWGPRYDQLLAESQETGDLLVLNGQPGDEYAYSQANRAIVDEALSSAHRNLAIIVWEGKSRGEGDATEEFRRLAAGAGFAELTISTC